MPQKLQGHIINSFRYPTDSIFDFADFYQRLSDKGHVIYPGKVTGADCVRIGNIGRIFPADVKALLHAIKDTLHDMGMQLPVSSMRSKPCGERSPRLVRKPSRE